jgi:hypothetical protein
MTKQLLIALGHPTPDVIPAYEHAWTEDEWNAWLMEEREKRAIRRRMWVGEDEHV